MSSISRFWLWKVDFSRRMIKTSERKLSYLATQTIETDKWYEKTLRQLSLFIGLFGHNVPLKVIGLIDRLLWKM